MLTIGQVAARAGVNASYIRYYETVDECGLFADPALIPPKA